MNFDHNRLGHEAANTESDLVRRLAISCLVKMAEQYQADVERLEDSVREMRDQLQAFRARESSRTLTVVK